MTFSNSMFDLLLINENSVQFVHNCFSDCVIVNYSWETLDIIQCTSHLNHDFWIGDLWSQMNWFILLWWSFAQIFAVHNKNIQVLKPSLGYSMTISQSRQIHQCFVINSPMLCVYLLWREVPMPDILQVFGGLCELKTK